MQELDLQFLRHIFKVYASLKCSSIEQNIPFYTNINLGTPIKIKIKNNERAKVDEPLQVLIR